MNFLEFFKTNSIKDFNFVFPLGSALVMVSWAKPFGFPIAMEYFADSLKWKELCYLMKESLFFLKKVFLAFFSFYWKKIKGKENPYICIMPIIKMKTLPIFLSKYLFLCQEVSKGLRTLLITELPAVVPIHLQWVHPQLHLKRIKQLSSPRDLL